MKEKGVIRDYVEWSESRRILYWRLRRRLLESRLAKEVKSVNTDKKRKHSQIPEMIRRWFIEDKGENQRFMWEHDKEVVAWLQDQVQDESRGSVVKENLRMLRKHSLMSELKNLAEQNQDFLQEAGIQLVHKMTEQKRAEFLEMIKNLQPNTSGESSTDDSSENGEA